MGLEFTDEEKAMFGGRNPQILLDALNELWNRMAADPSKYRSSPDKECVIEGIPATLILIKRAQILSFLEMRKETQSKPTAAAEVTSNDRSKRFKS